MRKRGKRRVRIQMRGKENMMKGRKQRINKSSEKMKIIGKENMRKLRKQRIQENSKRVFVREGENQTTMYLLTEELENLGKEFNMALFLCAPLATRNYLIIK